MEITRYGDIGTVELLRHKGHVITLIEGQPRARVNKVSPIHTMYERDCLTLAQFSAGKKLYDCWIIGWGQGGGCEVKERVDGGGKEREITTSQLHAMKEFERGKKAMLKMKLWNIINKVVINETSPTQKGTGGAERRRVMFWLRSGLDGLAREYGFM